MTIEHVQNVTLTEKNLIGYTVTVSLNQDLETGVVLALREKLLNNRHEITNQLDDEGMYLVQVYSDDEWTPDTPFISIVAVEVSHVDHIPVGFIQHTIPAGKFVKVTHKGPEANIGDTYDAIREQGIDNVRAFDFEHWTNLTTLDQDDNDIDIYLPL